MSHDSHQDKLGALKARIQKAEAQAHQQSSVSNEKESVRGVAAQMMRIGTDFVATILTATFLGWLLDRWLGWQPWGMLCMLLLGFCGGLLRIARFLAQGDSTAEE